jgi:hypothetical protein
MTAAAAISAAKTHLYVVTLALQAMYGMCFGK